MHHTSLALASGGAYLDRVTPTVQSMVSSAYVRDLAASRAFYGQLGFGEQSTGSGANSAWSYLRHGTHFILLASTTPALPVPPLPLLFYFYVEELDPLLDALQAADVAVQRVGHPPHALGGEAKIVDPDGNTVLLGQRERSASQAPATDDSTPHFSLLHEAAALVKARGGAETSCQIGNPDHTSCRKVAEVKLADSWGSAAWACLAHAEEVLIVVPGVFIAGQGDGGISDFLTRRHG